MKECKDKRLLFASTIVRDDEDELESDDLYSDEDLTLHLQGNLSCDPIEVMLEKNNMGIIQE